MLRDERDNKSCARGEPEEPLTAVETRTSPYGIESSRQYAEVRDCCLLSLRGEVGKCAKEVGDYI